MRKIAIVGPGASGKDTLIDKLNLQDKIGIKYTTRPIRPGEIRDQTYYYIKNSEFIEKINSGEMQIYQHFPQYDWYYGFDTNEFNTKNVFILTPFELQQLENRKEWFVLYLCPSVHIRRQRLLERADQNDNIEIRLQRDEKDFKGFRDYNLKVTNFTGDESYLIDLFNI